MNTSQNNKQLLIEEDVPGLSCDIELKHAFGFYFKQTEGSEYHRARTHYTSWFFLCILMSGWGMELKVRDRRFKYFRS